MKKIFRAQDEAHVEKRFIEDFQQVPIGWYTTRGEALDAWQDQKPAVTSEPEAEADKPVKRGRGRPRKAPEAPA